MNNGPTNTSCGYISSLIILFHGSIHQQNPWLWCSMIHSKPPVDAPVHRYWYKMYWVIWDSAPWIIYIAHYLYEHPHFCVLVYHTLFSSRGITVTMVVTKDYKMLPGFNQLESYSICIETHIHVIYYHTQRNTSDLPIDVFARLFQSE